MAVPAATSAGTVSGVPLGVIRAYPETCASCADFAPGSRPRYTCHRSPDGGPVSTTGGSTSETGKGRAGRQADASSRPQSTVRPSTATDVMVSVPWASLTEALLPER